MGSKFTTTIGFAIPVVMVALICRPVFLQAEIYKYYKDGIWHYSDSAPADIPISDLEILQDKSLKPADASNGPVLLADFPTRNPIERATAATVAIETAMGSGSGFFITPNGHIVTNKHVIRTTKAQSAQAKSTIAEQESQFQSIDRSLEDEKQRLKNFKNRLDTLHQEIAAETDSRRKDALQANYAENHRRYLNWQRDHLKRYQAYTSQKKKFNDQRQSYEYSQSLASLARNFTIILADKSEHYVYLLAVSQTHDLALLKLDGFQTPILHRGDLRDLVQGAPVYAIGSPVGLRNSVTSGIFSGFEAGFLQTNAQIYPGNSGGPLINADGRVMGINTFKKLTHKFEGLGFAIPISTAWQEFETFLTKP